MSTIKTGTTLTTAYQVEGDTTGALVIQTGATPTTAVTIGADQSTTFGGDVIFPDASTQNTAATGFGFKNRIINGAMVVNQRNTTVTANLQYTVDRWRFGKSNDAVESVAQSTDAPTGFTYSLKNTVGTADASISAAQYSNFKYAIEGYNVADLGFGTANAQTITISFWVKSSVAGLYTGNICNSVEDRICPFTYTVNSANTWEQKTYTFQGDTSGTWLTTNGIGLAMYFYMALGSNYYNGTAGTWGASPNYGAGGASLVNVLATAGNSFAITGVQLEKGSTATSFDYRPYGTELALCQRYYWAGYSMVYGYYGFGGNWPAGSPVAFPVTMRTSPTIAFGANIANTLTNSITAIWAYPTQFLFSVNVTGTGTMYRLDNATASAEL